MFAKVCLQGVLGIFSMNRTVLLIDDDEMCRTPAAAMLRRDQWNVFEAENGERGVALAIQHRPDVILCNLLMPRGNGFQVCKAVKEREELGHTKIFVISGRDYESDRQTALDAGADGFFVKPLEYEAVKEALAHIKGMESDINGDDGGFHVPKGRAELRFWGVRGSIPTPGPTTVFFGGNTSCVELRADGQLIVLDAGTGIRPLGQALSTEFGETPIELTLLVTHTHWDHIQGFPFFLPAYNARNHVRILGYEGARASLAATLAGQMESPYFPIALKQMPGNIVIEELKDMTCSIGPIRVEACFSNHPGVCVGYRLYTSAGSIVYMPDNEWSLEEGAVARGVIPATLEKTLTDFIRGADVVIMDCQYDRKEYATHIGWGHGCADDVVSLAAQAGVKQLFMFHHDPAHDDRFLSNMLVRARDMVEDLESELRVNAAREGERVVLAAVR